MTWRRIYRRGAFVFGWQIPQGKVKTRDLPDDIRIAVGPTEGALDPIRIIGGAVHFVTWGQEQPWLYPVPTLEKLHPGDWLMAEADGGITRAYGQRA